ncbi:hypothetical protein AMV163 [Betaentomopoxvirus amoorei]|uniref:AMV163 n=1 Tax=Amsacta moorei entomopoxvirus TaxID=28321 RepID=Q9EMN6_AMEPV|nr:hypothetical protein AMV163 [Amsacta moorei entomopoxvirus]AAG02869.1 AMV163 [Amsacta moorei entomopoxvirus]
MEYLNEILMDYLSEYTLLPTLIMNYQNDNIYMKKLLHIIKCFNTLIIFFTFTRFIWVINTVIISFLNLLYYIIDICSMFGFIIILIMSYIYK